MRSIKAFNANFKKVAKFCNCRYALYTMRKSFDIEPIVVNGLTVDTVIIDPHAAENHPDISDKKILSLVGLLDGVMQEADDIRGQYRYFATLLYSDEKQYRLIWLLEKNELYISVITAYRDDREV